MTVIMKQQKNEKEVYINPIGSIVGNVDDEQLQLRW